MSNELPEWAIVVALLPHAKPKARKELAKALRNAVRAEVREMATMLQSVVQRDVGEAMKAVYTERSMLETGVQALAALAERMQAEPKQLPPPTTQEVQA